MFVCLSVRYVFIDHSFIIHSSFIHLLFIYHSFPIHSCLFIIYASFIPHSFIVHLLFAHHSFITYSFIVHHSFTVKSLLQIARSMLRQSWTGVSRNGVWYSLPIHLYIKYCCWYYSTCRKRKIRNGTIFYTNLSVHRISLLVLLYMCIFNALLIFVFIRQLPPTKFVDMIHCILFLVVWEPKSCLAIWRVWYNKNQSLKTQEKTIFTKSLSQSSGGRHKDCFYVNQQSNGCQINWYRCYNQC